jgi:hypothetical protein
MAGEMGIGIGTGLLETAGNVALTENQFQQEQQLMAIQHANQQELNQQGHDLQFKMWQKTSYPEQVRMMKAAGLNPALMYKGAGPGGTTGSQGGGAASKGNAPQRPQLNMATMLMGLEMKSLEKDIENKEIQNELDRIEVNRQLGNNERGKEEIREITNKADNISEDTKLKVQQQSESKAREDLAVLQGKLHQMDIDKYLVNGLSPQDSTIVKTLTEGGMSLYDAWEWLWNSTLDEKMEFVFPLGPKWEQWAKEWHEKRQKDNNNKPLFSE